MSEIKLNSQLPKGTANGLDPIVAELCDRPGDTQVVIAIVDCKEVKTDTDTGEIIPTMRIRRIEAITGPDAHTVRRMFHRATERRTGREALPFGLVQEGLAALDDAAKDGAR